MSDTPAGQIDRAELQSIASLQKGILICILVYLLALVARLFLPASLGTLLGVTVLVVGVAAAVFVFMLAIRLYGTGLGVVLGILTLVPVLGLIMLLIVNAKATRILKENGIAVGLMGAQGPVT